MKAKCVAGFDLTGNQPCQECGATSGEDCGRHVEMLRRTLKLILPMAKGYAAEHPVGSNDEYVKEAERVLDGRWDAD